MSRRDRLVGVIQTAPPGVHALSSLRLLLSERDPRAAPSCRYPAVPQMTSRRPLIRQGPLANLNCNIPSEGRQLIRIRQALRAGISCAKRPNLAETPDVT